MSRKIGFWSLFSIVLGSQIGSGVFMLPASLAPFGIFGLFGWIASALGAIALCLVFAFLCSKLPKTGGPHVYVQEAFGPGMAFFTGWTYWIVSWVSTLTVIVTSVGYLTSFMPPQHPIFYLMLQIALLLFITALNLMGVKAAGNAEFFLGALKVIPLLILPLFALPYFNSENFLLDESLSSVSSTTLMAKVTLLTLWGFIGLETATTPAGSVENPSSTIPKAIVLGTLGVALLYIMNYIGITGLVPKEVLINSKAPYVDASQQLFGGNWHVLVSIIASIVCLGTLNAWILTSGQIALGLAEDGLLPKFFAKKNKQDAPYLSICISSIGIIPLLVLTANESLAQQITMIIDFSVIAFLFVYLASTLSFLRFISKEKVGPNIIKWIYGLGACFFCSFVIYESPGQTILVSSLFVLSGVPIYLFWYRREKLKRSELNSLA